MRIYVANYLAIEQLHFHSNENRHHGYSVKSAIYIAVQVLMFQRVTYDKSVKTPM